MGRTVTLFLLASAALALPGGALAHETGVSAAATEDTGQPCPGDGGDEEEFQADRVVTGEFESELEGGYVLLPFKVPSETTALRVRYCYDQPSDSDDTEPPDVPAAESSTLDLGLYEPRDDESEPWGPDEFRGWGGSSHPDVILSPEGFTSARRYARNSDNQVPGRTTRAFLPGDIPPGEWAVELGVAAVASESVSYRVEIDLSDEEDFAPDDPYRPAAYDASPASTERRWYAGDFHVHGEHSALGDAPMTEVFDYAFGSLAEGSAGLDFITLSDYVSGSSWNEVGRYQDDYPDNLIMRSAEVITYRGHANSHANTRVMDYRHGPLYELRRGDEEPRQVRGARPASETLDRIHSAGGFTQINHPTIFPSEVPTFASLCRGCPWDYTDAQTDYSSVDAIEIATGPAELGAPTRPGPNPFTVTGIQFWEDALAAGNKIAAVGSSDSHNAGRFNPPTQAPIGTATTMVFADELSETGIQEAVEAGHTYVKVTGNDAPDLRFRATAPGSGQPPAIMGDTLRAGSAEFNARVLGASEDGPYQLILVKDGTPFRTVPVTGDEAELAFEDSGPGRYRLQLQRGSVIEAVSSPIYLEARRGGGGGGESPTCRGVEATIVGTNGADRIVGTPGDDVIHARGGDDRVRGRGGADLICGGPGDDALRGNSGADRLLGQRGDDELHGHAGADRLLGRRGDDELRGDEGRDLQRGGSGDDLMRGGRGGDRLYGGPGRDDLKGNGGGDRLRGGRGRDRLRGGRGRDDVKGGPGRDDVRE